MPSFAEIYAACLYTGGEGYPLWNPSPLRLGDVGYVRDGSFIVLYNAIDGPGRLSDAASIPLARRFDCSPAREHASVDTGTKPLRMDLDETIVVPTGPIDSSRRSSLATPSVISSMPAGMSRSSDSDPLLPSSAKKGSPSLSHRRLRSGTPPEGLHPPMPLSVDQEAPKLFDMGPRMSSSYRCVGVNGGASVPSSPVNVKISFESSGGDGAILIPRDPTERTRLKYLGVLKAYIKAHHKWMYETYGRIESIGIDDLAFVYGQDRTSDWAVAVSRDAARGGRVEFEIFGSASAGFWGNWSHTLSACQRGPHRPHGPRSSRNVDQVKPPVEREPSNEGASSWGMNLEGGVINPSFSFAFSSSKNPSDDDHARGRNRNSVSRAQSITWTPEVHAGPDQTISIRRVTACTTPGLGFLPARPKAAAEPRDPDMDRGQDHGSDAVSGQDGNQGGDDDPGKSNHWSDDPLEALHDWIHKHGGAQIKVSIASDDDCLQLLSLLGEERVNMFGLRAAVHMAADRFARISLDEAGFATVTMSHVLIAVPKLVSTSSTALIPSLRVRTIRADSTGNEENMDQSTAATARPGLGKARQVHGVLKPRPLLSSARFNTMHPCRSMQSVGSACASLIPS